MRKARTIALPLACISLALLGAGCGGSGSPAGASSSTTTTRKASKPKRETGLEVNTGKTPDWAKVPASAPTQSGTVQIAYRNIAIEPDAVRVKVGSTIKWTNYDSVPHNVVSEGGPMHFSSGNFGEGHTYELKVTKTGVIHYECTLQPTTMNGTIEVVE
ncbi:MAG TPA: plastocyanin/azurin family copper-binding protein [Solirubrobacteraceae bacterium]|nr:plastocyanin/azurin family copper-binding protein [Solirubrobacteraceae bacterium]